MKAIKHGELVDRQVIRKRDDLEFRRKLWPQRKKNRLHNSDKFSFNEKVRLQVSKVITDKFG